MSDYNKGYNDPSNPNIFSSPEATRGKADREAADRAMWSQANTSSSYSSLSNTRNYYGGLTKKEALQLGIALVVPVASLLLFAAGFLLVDKIKTANHIADRAAAEQKHDAMEQQQTATFNRYVAGMTPSPLQRVETDLFNHPNRDEFLDFIMQRKASGMTVYNPSAPYQLDTSMSGTRISIKFKESSVSYNGSIKRIPDHPGCVEIKMILNNRFGAGAMTIQDNRCLQNGRWIPFN